MITKEKITAGIGTALFAALLLIILLFTCFTLASPPEELEGIPVLFGNREQAGGMIEPPMSEPVPKPAESSKPEIPEVAPDEPLITQNREPTIEVRAQREEERKRERERLAEEQRQRIEERRRRQEEENRRREEEARRRKEETDRAEINRKMSGLFGENAGSRGETKGEGTQGVTAGNAAQGSPTGSGGIGSYDLGGRSLGKGGLVQPRYTVNDYGTVVVNITVDPAGNVIHAEIGKGTTTPGSVLRAEALRAARSTKFNAINTANNQQGTITYRFNLR